MLAMELVAEYRWTHIWIEGDSNTVILAFKKPLIVHCRFHNHWHLFLSWVIGDIIAYFHKG